MFRKKIAVIMACSMLAAQTAPMAFAAPSSESSVAGALSDMKGHWAEATVNDWVRQGVVSGYEDGSFQPDRQVTRAEFAVMIGHIFHFPVVQADNAFTDVDSNAWYAQDVAAAREYGYVSGYPGGLFKPDEPIKRQDAALMIGKAFHMQAAASAAGLGAFSDGSEVAAYAQTAVKTLTNSGYMNGYPDGTLRPSGAITRAEAVVMLSRAAGTMLGAGQAETGEEIKGNVIVNQPGADLRNVRIDGNLYLAAGVGEGDVHLDHVTVQGQTIVAGGGANSVHFDNSSLGKVLVHKKSGPVRVVASGSTSVSDLTVQGSANLEAKDVTGSGIEQVHIAGEEGSAQAGKVKLDGKFAQVQVDASGTDLEVSENSEIDSVTSTEQASNMKLTISGKIGSLELKGKTSLNVTDKAQVGSLQIASTAGGTTVSSKGKINEAKVDADNVQVNGEHTPKGQGFRVDQGGSVTRSSSSSSGGSSGSSGGSGGNGGGSGNGGNNGGGSGGGTGDDGGGTGGNGGDNNGGDNPGQTDPWTLVWHDEFDGSQVDRTKWTFDLTNGYDSGDGYVSGWGNNEKEYYTEENAAVQDGKLLITAKKEDRGGVPYTSSRLKTAGLYAKKYGKFEIRAKLPTGQGYWPAIWMLPEDRAYGVWASSGEIDIMEAWGSKPNKVAGTIHYGETWPNNSFTGKEYQFPEGSSIADWHTYSLEWEPGEIRWYVDGTLYSTQNEWYSKGLNQADDYTYPAPFDQKFHLLLNLAVGGFFDGDPGPDTQFPKSMEVDYVRVYDLTGRAYRQPVKPVYEKLPIPSEVRAPLEDGNLVYNNNFDIDQPNVDGIEGVANTDYWKFQADPAKQAAATVSIDALDNRNFAKTTISSGGSTADAIQLWQEAPAVKGHTYKVTFDAKTSASRTISAKVSGGSARGYSAYSRMKTYALTNQVQSFEDSFVMKADTDLAANVLFNLGSNNGSVWIGNVKMVEIDGLPNLEDAAKVPLNGSGNHVYNGTFDQGDASRMTYWHVLTSQGAEASAIVSEAQRNLQVSITEPGSGEANSVQVLQKGINLIHDQTYELSFDAAASAAERTMEAELLSKDGSVSYGKQSVTLDTTLSSKTVSFSMTQPTDPEAQLVFHLGGSSGTVTLDNVKLVRTSIYFDPNVVFYPLQNGSFDNGMTGWEAISDSGYATGAVNNGEMKLTVANQGSQPWGALLLQKGLVTTQGLDYVVRFDARASVNRKMEVIAETSSYRRFFDQTVDLTNQMKTYEFTFRMTENQPLDLKFLVGLIADTTAVGSAHDIFIDNVAFEVKGAPTKPPVLAADQADNKVGKSVELTFSDDAAWRSAIQSVLINGAEIPADSYTVQMGSIILNASLFTTPATYTIQIQADGYAAAQVSQAVLIADNASWVEVGSNLLQDGSFTDSTEFGVGETSSPVWKTHNQGIYEPGKGQADFALANGQVQATVMSAGGEWWEIQLYQMGVPIHEAGTYKIAFDMNSDRARPVYADLGGQRETFDVSSGLHTYERVIDVAETGDKKFMFGLGKDAADPAVSVPYGITIDNVKVVKVVAGDNGGGGSDPVPVPEKQWVEVGDSVVQDGTFAASTQFGDGETSAPVWKVHNQGVYETGKGQADFTLNNGQVQATVTSAGGAWWEIQLYQMNVPVETGTYKLSMDVKSTQPRNVYVELQDVANKEVIAVDSTMKTYERILDVTVPGSKKLLIGLGEEAGDAEVTLPYDVTIDNVRLVKVVEAAGAAPTLHANTNGNYVGQPFDLTFTDSEAWRNAITSLSINGATVAESVYYNVYGGRIAMNPAGFPSPGTYTISVNAAGYPDAAVDQVIQALPLTDTLYLTGGAQGISGLSRFAGSAESSDIIVSAEGGTYLTVNNPVTYMFDGITAPYAGGSAVTTYALDLDTVSATAGTGVLALISYDFDGDGTWDRTEQSPLYALNPVANEWERFTQADRGSVTATGDYQDFHNGCIKLELWNQIGNGDTQVKVNAPVGQGSKIVIPYQF
ncbi:hemoblobin-interacting domain-containing protein [Paenibacillus hexagrammi]|uniref:Carbohydrate binding domain-containing protein n=1 Tax=Paenibacillus hexagrammi TaxID=2908839 RepID=A0ABY3SE27_9BACL|nr:carbohydrate binding domain-containing protein [Paenibacillus sp. YPD9-1]UJF32243.1 carbohydrate binding domain-containing protein [Paenibacillus sp. YPD9-1]